MDYEIYHDESKKDGYWHGMLLVPITKKTQLVHLLNTARENLSFPHPISLKGIRGSGNKAELAESWIQIGVAAMISRLKNMPYGVYLGKKKNRFRNYSLFKDPIGCKFILFRERDNLNEMSYYSDYGSKVEITFRMGFVGGLHYLGKNDEYISIDRLHFDNSEQYGRNISRRRVIDRINGLRDYCIISSRADLIDDRTSDHRKENAQSYDDCQLLQLTDLLIGSARTVIMGSQNKIHHKIASPMKALLSRYSRGARRMANSRWKNSLCLSQCYLLNGNWKFDSFNIQPKKNEGQLELFI